MKAIVYFKSGEVVQLNDIISFNKNVESECVIFYFIHHLNNRDLEGSLDIECEKMQSIEIMGF